MFNHGNEKQTLNWPIRFLDDYAVWWWFLNWYSFNFDKVVNKYKKGQRTHAITYLGVIGAIKSSESPDWKRAQRSPCCKQEKLSHYLKRKEIFCWFIFKRHKLYCTLIAGGENCTRYDGQQKWMTNANPSRKRNTYIQEGKFQAREQTDAWSPGGLLTKV